MGKMVVEHKGRKRLEEGFKTIMDLDIGKYRNGNTEG